MRALGRFWTLFFVRRCWKRGFGDNEFVDIGIYMLLCGKENGERHETNDENLCISCYMSDGDSL